MLTKLLILSFFLHNIDIIESNLNMSIESDKSADIYEFVTNNETFPYIAAILKKTRYISAGALIDENWVLTGADSLYLIRESVRILRVRLGSVNYKEGGDLKRVKIVQIHPYFDDRGPLFDLALVKLSEPVILNLGLNPIQLQRKPRFPNTRSFIVANWEASHANKTIKFIEKRRILRYTYLYPSDEDDCDEQLRSINENRTNDILCLDLPAGYEPCQRDNGAPVTLNGILWGIVSSWKPEDCVQQDPIIVNLVSPVEVSSWIHSIIQGHRWSKKHTVDYEDNFI